KYSKGLSKSYGTYHDYLPSASAKYTFNRNFDVKLGYSKSIKRPNLSQVAGAWSIDEANQIVTIPNPDLTPERSQKIDAQFEYYFEPAGLFTANFFYTELKGASDTFLETAADAGYGNDPVYGAYEFQSFANVPGTRRFKGIEL